MLSSISDIRRDYMLKSFDETHASSNPFDQFRDWWEEATSADIDEVNAMTLATVDGNGKPAARIVLLKGYTHDGFVFFTNYESAKGQDLAINPNAALLFFWKELERQIRIEGTVEKIDPADSDAYFHSRPAGSRIGAWVSPQSKVIPNRAFLENNYNQLVEKYPDENAVPRPPHWGGFIVKPESFEFWQGRSSRLHDRLKYTKSSEGWNRERLAP
ncbi:MULTISPECIES: pyridoxamine 5'-phosphate oxidase [Sediminibacterium]|jgi:pyridoxamine 5'-phosphate oxidase|uniref:pyridoxamine 5'-phosphate oxidase n=1 Tax=Sediminibacterium TaxID=504481 RepID=UPI00047AF993|nr:pyridoxamine 5'-phosphate oxidase [Sediminibacterium salmoneum]